MEDLQRMMANIREQQRQERELRERYDEQWDYSGTGIPGKIDPNNKTNKQTHRSLQSDKGRVRTGAAVLVRPPRQARSPKSRGKNNNNTNTNITLPLTKLYPGNTTAPITRTGGVPTERKGKRPGRPGKKNRGRQNRGGPSGY